MKLFGRSKIAMLLAAALMVMAALSLFVGAEGEAAEPLDDFDGASEYLGGYEDNLVNDENFETNLEKAISTIRESVKRYATLWALVPPVLAIALALITKEVYSSLFIGILSGALIYSNFHPVSTLTKTFEVISGSLGDSWNIGILIFLVILGIMVCVINRAGGSAAFGRWAQRKIKGKRGASLATFLLGAVIFVDDYFNCLTVGSVMRPVTDGHKISRAKLAYLIDATAAPICIIAPISSWAAAVASVAAEGEGLTLFIRSIPYNFYALLTIIMVIFTTIIKLDYGPMKLHEDNAAKGDLFTTSSRPYSDTEEKVNERGSVVDLLLPVIVLIGACVVGMVYTGGFFDGEGFIMAFANCDASVGLVLGSFCALLFTFIYYLLRRVVSFKTFMNCVVEGFKAMVPAILILTFAWSISGISQELGSKILVAEFIRGTGSVFQNFLPVIIFVIACGMSFATGTSWGTFGILLPIVTSIFGSGELMMISVSACLAGAVCGDHCSPISDTTIMASTGAQCDHLAHVSTQLPYVITVAAVSAVSYIIAGFVQNVWIALPAAILLLIGTLTVIKLIQKKKSA
ncbi:MAG: Na+/H+ antiporter NhaC family protein [Clostridiales bacterium]|nr:Na+/H+ antiporter NhaC family protein [Clostridiales bacterium]